jgi:hypothetical protein
LKIYSNFVDYYDGVQYFGASYNDPLEQKFIRKTEDVKIRFSGNEFIRRSFDVRNYSLYSKIDISFTVVFFCGKPHIIPNCCGQHFSSFEKILQESEKLFSRKETLDEVEKYIKGVTKRINRYLDFTVEELKVNDPEFYIRLNAPYFIITSLNTRGEAGAIEITKNPHLKSIGFHKVMDAYTAYQEIEMFFNSVLINNTDKDVPQITDDKILCEAKGFDKKISFRKRSSA